MKAPFKPSAVPTVSVVIPSKDRPDAVRRLLLSVNEQTYPIEDVLVIDDGSSPALRAISREVIYRNEVSRGAGPSRNVGAEQAQSDYLLVLDDDTILHDPELVRKCVDTLREFPFLAALALRQLQPDLSPWYVQPCPHDKPCLATTFYGVGFFIKRSAMLAVGAFSDRITFNYEENELALRLIDAGYEIAYDPRLSLIHAEDARHRDWGQRFYAMYRNACYTAILRYPAWAVLPGIMSHLYRYIRITRANSTFRASKLAKLFLEIATNLPDYLSDRQAIKSSTMVKVLCRSRTVIRLEHVPEALPQV